MATDRSRGGAESAADGPALEESAPARRWSLRALALTIFVAFAVALALTSAVALALGSPGRSLASRSPEELLALTAATDLGLLAVVATLGRRLLRLRPEDLGLIRPDADAIRYAVSFGVALYALSILVNVVQIRLTGEHPQDLVVAFGTHTGLRAYAIDLANGSGIAPFTEEIFFRGLIFGGLAHRFPVVVAAIVSALLFGLLHGLGVIAPIFVLGLGLAYVYRRTGSVWASMTTHSLVNAVSLTLLFVLPSVGGA
jgi:membrane protease YdiL (CAAX protease family)